MCVMFLGWYSRESRLDGHTQLLSAGNDKSALLGSAAGALQVVFSCL